MAVEMSFGARRDLSRALWRGFVGKRPRRCGGERSCAVLAVHDRTDDASAYSVILIAGHLVAPRALSTELEFAQPHWLHALLWGPLTPLLALALLQPVKGAVVVLRWGNRMHGFEESRAGRQHGGVAERGDR